MTTTSNSPRLASPALRPTPAAPERAATAQAAPATAPAQQSPGLPAAHFDAAAQGPSAYDKGQLPAAGGKAPEGSLSPLGARLAAVARVDEGKAGPATKVGVLLTSHGDIDNVDTELRGYVREAVLKNPGLPLPKWVRPAIDKVGWPLQKDLLREQYAATGPTRYHENTLKQAAALDEALKEVGIDGKAYVGYNFLPPFIDDAVEQMKKDGVTHIVVFNQGAQNSVATMGESIDEVHQALEKFPDWKVKATAVTEFNDDNRFVSLLGDRLIEDAQKAFPGHKPEETLLFITSHGLPQHLIDKGDGAVADMMATFDKVKERLAGLGYQVEHGFLNDDFFPGAKWTGPKAEERADLILQEVAEKKRISPKHVLLDGRLSFTIHHRATLYDADVVVREKMESPAGPPWARFPGAEVKLAPNFDGDPGLASLFANLTKETLAGKADNLQAIRE